MSANQVSGYLRAGLGQGAVMAAVDACAMVADRVEICRAPDIPLTPAKNAAEELARLRTTPFRCADAAEIRTEVGSSPAVELL